MKDPDEPDLVFGALSFKDLRRLEAFPGICIPNPHDNEIMGYFIFFPSPLSPAVCAFPPLVRNQDIAEAQLI